MKKSLGSKRNYFTDKDIENIVKQFGNYQKRQNVKIFPAEEFGYPRITIERPLRLSVQFTEEKISVLRFQPTYSELMEWMYEQFGDKVYTSLKELKEPLENYLKETEQKLNEKQKKEILFGYNWNNQKKLLEHARTLMNVFGNKQFDDYNEFLPLFEKALKENNIQLDAKERKQILNSVSWKNPDAARVILFHHKAKPSYSEIYGDFPKDSEEVVRYTNDSELRDYENVPLKENIETYFLREVKPHVPDAWIDSSKIDSKDKQIGIVGYEIPFNRYFYEYKPPRELDDIDKDLEGYRRLLVRAIPLDSPELVEGWLPKNFYIELTLTNVNGENLRLSLIKKIQEVA